VFRVIRPLVEHSGSVLDACFGAASRAEQRDPAGRGPGDPGASDRTGDLKPYEQKPRDDRTCDWLVFYGPTELDAGHE
jgi:hypothetical protein